ncbi:amino acid ABC transporter permease [Nocardioides sp. SLBN-35]|uniref:amino acid ABC transporter permease n=1 Tax=Nocardioides sp. SLBN-35 TaxID=2768445 RepID=UPI00114D7CF7|nr:amino acid ABC transporter permease [Nocardioides sp. SLBN-35]TQK69627.1 amino acid ABC transporter membrane protein 1 (PAAT family) [Nocardioides sp. SLBN-35]
MEDVFSHFDLVLKAFWLTVQLAFLSGVAALVLGTALAAMRVGPIAVLRWVAATYVTLVRNTPLLLMCVFIFFAAPNVGLLNGTPYLLKGTIAVSLYTAPFVAESLRSGVNAVPLGQAEAARAIGMTFGQNMRHVVLPQAFRASVPPLASTLIAMTKNTSVVAVFGLLEATARMRYFVNRNADDTMLIFVLFAIGYIVLVELISLGAVGLERRWKAAR